MKRYLLALLLALVCGLSTKAQTTLVSGTITDSGGQTWNNGTYTFISQALGQTPITGSLSATGTYTSVSIPHTQATSLVGDVWQVNVCPSFPFGCFTSNPITIAGVSQTINFTPGAIAFKVPLTPQAVTPITAYSDAEVTGGWIGFQYYNITNTGNRVCTAVNSSGCTTYAAAGGGISLVSSLPATCTVGVTANVQLSIAVSPYQAGQEFWCSATNVWSPSSTSIVPGIFNTTTTITTWSSPNAFVVGTPPSGTIQQCVQNVQNAFASPTGFTDTDALDGCAFIPTSGVTNGVTVGVEGSVYNNNSSAAGQFGWVGGVGIGGLCVAGATSGANQPHCWGASLGSTSLTGSTGAFLAGSEVDIQANNNTDTGFGFLASMRGTGVATADNMKAFQVQSTQTNQWTSGFDCSDLSLSVASGAVCMYLGKQTAAAGTGSQALNFKANDGSADFTLGFNAVGSTASNHRLQTGGGVAAAFFDTFTNCTAVGTSAAPSVASCSAAPAGLISCAATQTSCQVNTTAVTSNSEIFLSQRLDTTAGTRLGVTCNVTPSTVIASQNITAVSSGSNFLFSITAPVTNPSCWNYWIVNL